MRMESARKDDRALHCRTLLHCDTLSEPALTAELVFDEVLKDGQDDSDYHNTMTGAKFTAWIRNRLLPTFNKLYPGKKMYLVLDNAAYHKPRDETWISAAKQCNTLAGVIKHLDLKFVQNTIDNVYYNQPCSRIVDSCRKVYFTAHYSN